MKPIIDHLQITVKDMRIAEPFYDKFLPILGFDINLKSRGEVPEHKYSVIEYVHPLFTFGINSPRDAFKEDEIHRRKPGSLHHLAFKAASRDEVDRLYIEIKEIGAIIVDEPKLYPQHGPNYYALFFKDLEGIKYEIVYETEEA